MRIEIHDDDGNTYAYKKRENDPFKWDFYTNGQHMPKSSEAIDGRDVLWQMASYVQAGVETGVET